MKVRRWNVRQPGHFVGVRSGLAAAGLLTGAFAPGYAGAAPVFTHDVAPIVHQYCAPCHRPGEAGPFSLLTYKDVKAHASQIADVTRRRYMPPWLPEPGHGSFKDELRLTADQIQTIADWVAAGSPEGPPEPSPSNQPPAAAFNAAEAALNAGWQLGEPDLILEASQ